MALYNSGSSYEKSRREWRICGTHRYEFQLLSKGTLVTLCNLGSSPSGNFAYDITPQERRRGIVRGSRDKEL